ncbi:hypothetical protein SBADM41S_02846 [Streptomyces badius]
MPLPFGPSSAGISSRVSESAASWVVRPSPAPRGRRADVVRRGRLGVELPGHRRDRALLDDRLVLLVRVAGVQVLDLVLVQAAGQQRTVDLVLHVAAQVPGHRLEPGHRVDRGPLTGLVVVGQTQRRVLDRDVPAFLALQVRVDALRVRLEVLLGALVEDLVVLPLRHLPPAERTEEGVGLDLPGTEHLGEPAGRHVAPDVHLPEAVLGLDEALGAEEVGVGVRVDLRNPVGVAFDLDVAGKAVELYRSGGLRVRRPHGGYGPVRPVPDTRDERQHQDEHDQAGTSPLLPAGLLRVGRAGRVGCVGGHRCP